MLLLKTLQVVTSPFGKPSFQSNNIVVREGVVLTKATASKKVGTSTGITSTIVKLLKILFLWSQLPNFQIAGRLKHFLKRGNSNKGSEYFRNCEGISIPFLPQPLQQQLPREINLTLKEKYVVTEEIGEFLKKVHMEKFSAKSQFAAIYFS